MTTEIIQSRALRLREHNNSLQLELSLDQWVTVIPQEIRESAKALDVSYGFMRSGFHNQKYFKITGTKKNIEAFISSLQH